MKKIVVFLVLFFCMAFTLFGQTRPRLAILPFSGGDREDGETIAGFFTNQPEIRQTFSLLPRTQIDNILREHDFQENSGLTDTDTIIAMGRHHSADYVVAGHITQLGQDKKLLHITIIHVNSLQQMGGAYREYSRIEETRALLPDMARAIVSAMQLDTSNRPRLAVLPLNTRISGAAQSDAEVLAQILATEIANSGMYAVFPRTTSLERVRAEHEIFNTGMIDPETAKRIGFAVNAEYVLSAEMRSLGSDRYFTADILHLETGEQEIGTEKQYQSITDGLLLMPEIARELTGIILRFQVIDGRTITITAYNGTDTTVRIPETIEGKPVTAIGPGAFGNKTLISVTIPNSVTTIGNSAFSNNQLTSITIPNSVTLIGNSAFSYNRLTSVTISNSVTTIGNSAFSNNQLTSIIIPNSVTLIGHSAFSYNRLTSVTIPNRVTSIEGYTFSHNQLTSVTISNSVTLIENSSFSHNQLTSITIPNSVTSIGNDAFAYNQLTSITIPNSIISIRIFAFNNNPLTHVTIGANVNLGEGAFPGQFNNAYTNNNRRAGTYTRSDANSTTWRR